MSASSPLAALDDWRLDSTCARGLLAAAGMLLLVGVEQALNAAGFELTYLTAEETSHSAALGFALAAVLVAAISPPTRRSQVLLGISLLAYPFFLGAVSIAVATYVLGVCALGRSRLALSIQLALALLSWVALPIYRWVQFPTSFQLLPQFVMMVWAGLAYSSVYLLVERARLTEKPSLASELFYLIALPRLLSPFWQPISPSYLRYRERPMLSVGAIVRAVGLGAYALLLGAVIVRLRHFWTTPHWAPLEVVVGVVISYCFFGKSIFIAVSLFRLMGFELASGFRQPFLAVSYADYFTRWNHYVRDAVLSLFFIPLFVRLRRRYSPKAAAIYAGFFSIFLGSFALYKVLTQFAVSPDLKASLQGVIAPGSLVTLGIYWAAIILPSAPRGGWVAEPRSGASSGRARWVQVAGFLVSYFALMTAVWAFDSWQRLKG